jgi:hypothetical protein
MPHYFFNLLFGDHVSQDEEGVELRDHAAARDEAFAIIRELSDPALGANPRRWAGCFLQVADEEGAFLRTPIGYPALEVVTEDWQPASQRIPARQARPVQQVRRQPTGRKVSAMVRQTLARRSETAVLMEQNRQLLEEILRMTRKCKEIHARAKFLVECAQHMERAIEPDYHSAGKRPRLVARGTEARHGPRFKD